MGGKHELSVGLPIRFTRGHPLRAASSRLGRTTSRATVECRNGWHCPRRSPPESGPARLAAATELRLRAFTLVFRTYEDARSAIGYLRRRQSHVESIAPSLYAGRGRRKQSNPAPDVTQIPAGTVSGTEPAPGTALDGCWVRLDAPLRSAMRASSLRIRALGRGHEVVLRVAQNDVLVARQPKVRGSNPGGGGLRVIGAYATERRLGHVWLTLPGPGGAHTKKATTLNGSALRPCCSLGERSCTKYCSWTPRADLR